MVSFKVPAPDGFLYHDEAAPGNPEFIVSVPDGYTLDEKKGQDTPWGGFTVPDPIVGVYTISYTHSNAAGSEHGVKHVVRVYKKPEGVING